MSAQELRKAAETLRTLAHAAAGEWHPRDDWYRVHELHSALVGVKTSTNANDDATYIATMHPGVGLALADWLTHSARHAQTREDNGCPPAESSDQRPLRVARLINGAQP